MERNKEINKNESRDKDKRDKNKGNKEDDNKRDKDKEGEINCISVRANVHNQHPAIAKSKLDTPPQNRH